MHPTTQLEVKRLEYELRIDAAAKCPGTVVARDEPEEPERDSRIAQSLKTKLADGAIALTTMMRSRSRVRAE